MSQIKQRRYNKHSTVFYQNKQMELIECLQILLRKSKVTKTAISRLVKNNTTWYSQLDRKTDDGRYKFIQRNDLISVISILRFHARTKMDLEFYAQTSADYIDNELKAVSIDKEEREMTTYKIFQKLESQEERFQKEHDRLSMALQYLFDSCRHDERRREAIIHAMQNFNYSLELNPSFMVAMMGLQYYKLINLEDTATLKNLCNETIKQIDTYYYNAYHQYKDTKESIDE